MTLPSLLIVDDFLADPVAARNAALALDYDPAKKRGNYPGLLSTDILPIQGLDERVGRLIGAGVRAAPQTSHGQCRMTRKGDRGISGVHIDPAFYSGLLYLSRPEDCPANGRGGTEFFRHKRTGLERIPSDPVALAAAGFASTDAAVEDIVNRDTNHAAKWERVLRVPIRFNRLILFSPWLFHNAGAAFGTQPENARLVNLMFFARA